MRRRSNPSRQACFERIMVLPPAGHTLDYPLRYLQQHLSKLSGRVKLQQASGQKAREATPVSSPSNEQFNIVARAIYETVQPKEVPAAASCPASCSWNVTVASPDAAQACFFFDLFFDHCTSLCVCCQVCSGDSPI